jgi:sugar/nucleoside kinase (ribokinase family)
VYPAQVPPAYEVKSEDMLRRLSAQPPDIRNWEVGGSCNLLIAAARLGMSAATIGNLGEDVYGDFVRKILKVNRRLLVHLSCDQSTST